MSLLILFNHSSDIDGNRRVISRNVNEGRKELKRTYADTYRSETHTAYFYQMSVSTLVSFFLFQRQTRKIDNRQMVMNCQKCQNKETTYLTPKCDNLP